MIDGGITLGRNPATGQQISPDDIEAFLDRHGLAAAIANHYAALYFDVDQGNEALLALARKHPGRIIPAVHLTPINFDDAGEPGYIAGLQAAGARVLGIMQRPGYAAPLGSLLLRPIVEASVQAGLTLQFSVRSQEELCETFRRFGDLPTPFLVRWLGGGFYQSLAEALYLLRRYPNALMDVGSITTVGGIEKLVATVGGHRLFLASNSPETYACCSISLLHAAHITDADKAAIAHNTLAGLFDLPRKRPAELNPLLPKAAQRLFERDKIDTHYHYCGWNALEAANTRDRVLGELATPGTRALVISSSKAINEDLVAGNQELEALLGSDPRLFGLIVIDPLQIEASIRQIRQYAGQAKFVGIKTTQDMYGLPLHDAGYQRILEAARPFGLPVLAHKPGMAEAAKLFPDIIFINAHANWLRSRHLTGYPNICFDLTTSHADVAESRLDLFIAQAGADRILFGSDSPLISPAWTLGKLASLELTEAQLEAILIGNALRIFPKLRP